MRLIMRNIRYPIILLTLSTVLLSTYLTCSLMYNLASAADLAVVFVFIGLVLESCKYLFSVVAAKAHNEQNQTGTAIIYGLATALLMGVSFLASMASVEQASNSLVAQSGEYQQLSHRIETNQLQATKTRSAANELPATYITKRKELLNQADKYDSIASDLLVERKGIKSNSFFVQYNTHIAIMVAALVELVGLLLIPIFANYPPSLASKIRNTEPTKTIEATRPEVILNHPKPVQTRVEAKTEAVIPEPVNPLIGQIKQAVINREVKPSVGGIKKKFSGIGSDKMSAILKELNVEGILKPKGEGLQGWDYV